MLISKHFKWVELDWKYLSMTSTDIEHYEGFITWKTTSFLFPLKPRLEFKGNTLWSGLNKVRFIKSEFRVWIRQAIVTDLTFSYDTDCLITGLELG